MLPRHKKALSAIRSLKGVQDAKARLAAALYLWES